MSSVLDTYNRKPISFAKGKGSYLYTKNGDKYLDMVMGIATNLIGHSNEHLLKAIQEQSKKLIHISNAFVIPSQEKLAKRLTDNTFADLVFFTNSGTESIEASIKIVRKYFHKIGKPEKNRLISIQGAFHGRSLAALFCAKNPKHIEGFGPEVDGFDQVQFGDYEAIKKSINKNTAGIICEVIQGEGGIKQLSDHYLKRLRKLCDEHDILLILDEVQTFCRTGNIFAFEKSGIIPDICSIAKGIGGGYPLGACLVTKKVSVGMTPGTHGSTFGGNPLAMAAGHAVLDIIFEKDFFKNVKQKGEYFDQGLNRIKDKHPMIIGEIRGIALMKGLKMLVDNNKFIKKLMDHKMLTVKAEENVIRLFPSLLSSANELQEGLDKIEKVCEEMSRL
jgi:acetylornithine/N-succinyldiaminopimelate aminotransferase